MRKTIFKPTVQRALRSLGLKVSRVPRDGQLLPSDFDHEVIPIIKQALPYTMTGAARLYNLCRAIEYVVQHDIPGDIVECGVWKGGSCMAAALQLLRLGDTSRNLYLCDTFNGMTEPTEHDRVYTGESARQMFENRRGKDADIRLWAYATLGTVKGIMSHTDYPEDKLRYVIGKVEDTLPLTDVGRISVLRLDTDWYESTRTEMCYLFPKLAIGGVLLIDDYGTFTGAAQAVDEYLQENDIRIFLTRVDEGLYMGIKQEDVSCKQLTQG